MFAHEIFQRCPRCGSEGIFFEHRKALVCPDCQFRYYINPASGVGVLLREPGGRLVVTRRALDPGAGLFDLPGGFVDFEESLEDAARRELTEEIGFTPGPLDYVGSFPNIYNFRDVTYHVIDTFFESEIPAGISFKLDPGEIEGLELVDPEEITLEQFAFGSHRRALQKKWPSLKRHP